MNEIITPPHLMAYDQDKFILKVKRIREDAMTTQAYIATMIGRDPGTFSKQMNKKFDFSLNDAAALLSDGTLWEGQIALYFRWTCLPDCAVPELEADYRRNNRRLS